MYLREGFSVWGLDKDVRGINRFFGVVLGRGEGDNGSVVWS